MPVRCIASKTVLPILEDMRDWLMQLRIATADGSGLGRAD